MKGGPVDVETVADRIEDALRTANQEHVLQMLAKRSFHETGQILERLPVKGRVAVVQLLPEDTVPEVFEALDLDLQRELILRVDPAIAYRILSGLDPDDRARLIGAVPPRDAERLFAGLTPMEQDVTATLLRYRPGTIGQWVSSQGLSLTPEDSVTDALRVVAKSVSRAESLFVLPVADADRQLLGMVSLPSLVAADPLAKVTHLMRSPEPVSSETPAEDAARRCADLKLPAMPVVDEDDRLVGTFTVTDALRILEDAESEDLARAGGSEPLRRPYLSTPVRRLVRSRFVWLLVLAVSATLTVQVLELFEATLEQMVVLALFIPLLTGTGGNTGNQAATTVTRAVALGDVRFLDIGKVMLREVRVGASLGLILGGLGFVLTSIFYGAAVGAVIGLTLLSVCTMAATVGGAMPLIGKYIRVDPAVFSNPFISTFCDATGLLIYFLIANAILNL
jgi:magnesium transporter